MTYPKGTAKAKAYRKAEYDRNKAYYQEYSKRRVAQRQNFINALKKNPCTDCGGHFPPICMDFDHLPEFSKDNNISRLAALGYNMTKLVDEIAKCELVCANCHRIRGQKRQQERTIAKAELI